MKCMLQLYFYGFGSILPLKQVLAAKTMLENASKRQSPNTACNYSKTIAIEGEA